MELSVLFLCCITFTATGFAGQHYLMPVSSQDKLGGLQQKGHSAKKMGDDRGGVNDSPDGVASRWIIGPSSSVSCFSKIQIGFYLSAP